MPVFFRSRLLLLHLSRFSIRHAFRAPLTSAALIGIIALGVAVFFSVRLSNRAAVRGFQFFTQSISGGSDFVVSGPGGALDQHRLAGLRNILDPLPLHLVPLVEGSATLPGTGNDTDGFDAAQVPILGMDLIAARNLVYARSIIGYQPYSEDSDQQMPLAQPDAVYLTEPLARQLNLNAGDGMDVIIGDQLREFKVTAVLVPDQFQAGRNERLIIMDLPALQQLLDQPGRIDRVEIVVPEGDGSADLIKQTTERLNGLPSNLWNWSTTAAQRESAYSMTAAFRLNLTTIKPF